jgi:hypothetical protein
MDGKLTAVMLQAISAIAGIPRAGLASLPGSVLHVQERALLAIAAVVVVAP